MSAVQLFCQVAGVEFSDLSKHEIAILETDLFISIYNELGEQYYQAHKEYFLLMKFTKQMEMEMIDSNLVKFITRDLLESGDYDLNGLSLYLGMHEDVVIDVLDGKNLYPSVEFLRRIFDLHRIARRELYTTIMRKIANRFTQVAA